MYVFILIWQFTRMCQNNTSIGCLVIVLFIRSDIHLYTMSVTWICFVSDLQMIYKNTLSSIVSYLNSIRFQIVWMCICAYARVCTHTPHTHTHTHIYIYISCIYIYIYIYKYTYYYSLYSYTKVTQIEVYKICNEIKPKKNIKREL